MTSRSNELKSFADLFETKMGHPHSVLPGVGAIFCTIEQFFDQPLTFNVCDPVNGDWYYQRRVKRISVLVTAHQLDAQKMKSIMQFLSLVKAATDCNITASS